MGTALNACFDGVTHARPLGNIRSRNMNYSNISLRIQRDGVKPPDNIYLRYVSTSLKSPSWSSLRATVPSSTRYVFQAGVVSASTGIV